ncbi:MAG: hypothetical protein EOO04_20570 [Chitinophagaceae bacterium]|nr:MAG: hypothetical protein EOO04_20570 [Chitinophagaceae bacterium]
MIKNFTIIIFTEANVGAITRITTMISRRLMDIESLHVAPADKKGIYRFTVVISQSEEAIRKLMLQIDKQVDVFKTFYHSNEEAVWVEQDSYFKNELSHII